MSGSAHLDGIARDAEAVGIFKHKGEIVHGRPVVSWIVTCGQCGAQHKAAWAPDMAPAIMLKQMKMKRWYIGHGKTPKCPTCCNAPKKGPETVTVGPSLAQSMINITTQNPAPKIVRAVYRLLDENYNENTRRYGTGWDDARIAKAAECAPQIVKQLREEAFGKLAEDPRLQPLREDIELQRLLLEDFFKQTAKKLDEMAQRLAKVTG